MFKMNRTNNKMISKGIPFCPKCKSEDVDVSVSPFGTHIFRCRDCGCEAYTFPEKQILKSEDKIGKLIKHGVGRE